MDFSDQSTIQTQNAVFNSTIVHCSSSEHTSGTKNKPPMDAIVREYIAARAIDSASFDAAERGDPPKCHPDTRIAVQDSLVAWRSKHKSSPVRLISGWAGTGKTTIAQTLAEYWARRGQLAGSFFFSRSSQERSETFWVSATILHQFIRIFGQDVDVKHLYGKALPWSWVVGVLASTLCSHSQPMVIVIDGLDECRDIYQQESFLRSILNSLDQLGSSIKILISCRPERHLEDVLNEFAPKLGLSYRIHLGQSAEDDDDIRTFFRVSFDRISQHRRQDGAMSITDGLWPSQEEIKQLVVWASGQFIFAATVVRFVDDENEDPVEMLNLVLEQRTSSFEAIDQLYIVILERVGMTLDKSEKSLERRQLMHNLILHVDYKPSSSLTIAGFWFEKEVMINILVKHLQAVLVRNPNPHYDGRNSETVIQFRHKSFHDFFARPSAPHSFSLAEMNPVSKFFFSLRIHARRAAYPPGYDDHLPTDLLYEQEARQLHQAYIQDRPTFRGCKCLPQLEPAISDIRALRRFKPCRQRDCVAKSDLLTLCKTIAISLSPKEQERLSPILKFLLWLRAALSLKRQREDAG